jgi:hypothetical protein
VEPELCPPWWPSLIWSLLHPHPHEPDPEEEWIKLVSGPMEEIFGALATYVQAHAFLGAKHEELRAQVQQAAVEQMSMAVEQLRG